MSRRSDYYEFEPTVNDEESCRVCTDFKSWTNVSTNQNSTDVLLKKNVSHNIFNSVQECPLNRQELGQKTWSFLHTMAASYPESPPVELQKDMRKFFNMLSELYPCSVCAEHLKKQLIISPPLVGNQGELKEWLCWIHNNVNRRLGKPVFDCKLVDERWKAGKSDGSCLA